MTADRVVVLILIVGGIAFVTAFNRTKLARMSAEERAQFDRNMAPFTRAMKVFLWVVVVLGVVGAIGAALDVPSQQVGHSRLIGGSPPSALWRR